MTVGTADRIVEYPGDDSATPRAVPFMFLANDDLRVTRINANGSRAVLIRGTDYSVAGAANPAGGSVTPLAPIGTGTTWRIEGVMPLGQPIEYTSGDDFPAKSHERGLDRAMIAAQEQRRDLDEAKSRSLMVPIGELAPEVGSLVGADGMALGVVDGKIVPIANDVAGAEQIKADVAAMAAEVEQDTIAADNARQAAIFARNGAVAARAAAEDAEAGAEAALAQAEAVTQAASDALAAGTISDLVGNRIYSSQAALYADLVPADNLYALVVGDPDPAKNDLYQKNGAATAGSWDGPLGIFASASALAQNYAGQAAASSRAAIEQLGTISRAVYPTTPPYPATGYAGAGHYVWETAQKGAGFLLGVTVGAGQAGSFEIGLYSRDGAGEMDRLRYETVNVAGSGISTIPLMIRKGANEHVGIRIDGDCLQYLSGPDPSGGFWARAGGLPFTDNSKEANFPISISVELIELDAIPSLDSRVDKIEDDFYETVTAAYGLSAPIASQAVALDGSYYVVATPMLRDERVVRVPVNFEEAGTLTLHAFNGGASKSVLRSYGPINVDAGASIVDLAVPFPVNAGEHFGFRAPGLGVTLSVTSEGLSLLGSASLPVTATDPIGNTRAGIGFETEYTSPIMAGGGGGSGRPSAIDLPWSNMLIIGMGQSLMEGSHSATNGEPDVTTVQEYDTLCFPAYPAAPNVLLPATTNNSERKYNGPGTGQPLDRGEWSGLGAARQLRDAIARDYNITHLTLPNKVVIANNGIGSQHIAQISKGTVAYNAALAQATALSIVSGEGSGVLAVIFGQGESDSAAYNNTGYATYKARLKTFASDIDADLRVAAGQKRRVPTIAYQLGSIGRDIALAQLDASLESDLITIACPMYQLAYYDGLHIDAVSERRLGGYYGEAIATVAAGKVFEPLRPIAAQVVDSTVTLTFNRSGLVFDTTLVPAQLGNGFKSELANGTPNNPTSAQIINGNQVRLTFSTPPDSGSKIYYGLGYAADMSPYTGGAGNLRDSAGDSRKIDGFPLHNWCVLFDWVL